MMFDEFEVFGFRLEFFCAQLARDLRQGASQDG